MFPPRVLRFVRSFGSWPSYARERSTWPRFLAREPPLHNNYRLIGREAANACWNEANSFEPTWNQPTKRSGRSSMNVYFFFSCRCRRMAAVDSRSILEFAIITARFYGFRNGVTTWTQDACQNRSLDIPFLPKCFRFSRILIVAREKTNNLRDNFVLVTRWSYRGDSSVVLAIFLCPPVCFSYLYKWEWFYWVVLYIRPIFVLFTNREYETNIGATLGSRTNQIRSLKVSCDFRIEKLRPMFNSSRAKYN